MTLTTALIILPHPIRLLNLMKNYEPVLFLWHFIFPKVLQPIRCLHMPIFIAHLKHNNLKNKNTNDIWQLFFILFEKCSVVVVSDLAAFRKWLKISTECEFYESKITSFNRSLMLLRMKSIRMSKMDTLSCWRKWTSVSRLN